MTDPFDPDLMTPEARAREVAEILATGYLRHRELRARTATETAAAVLRATTFCTIVTSTRHGGKRDVGPPRGAPPGP